MALRILSASEFYPKKVCGEMDKASREPYLFGFFSYPADGAEILQSSSINNAPV
jgi:hypothetical protein